VIGVRRLWVVAKFLGALILVFLMLVWPGEALFSAQRAMRVWAYSVGPSLFPFLALLPSLTCPAARRAYERVLGGVMRPLFKLPGSAAAAVFTGMLAGSPAGALASARVGGGMRRGEFKRMALMTTGASPVYLMSGVGVALFGSPEFGLWLIIGQAVAQILTGFALRNCFSGETEIVPQADQGEAEKPVRTAVLNILQVCGYMVMFSVGAGLLARLAGEDAGRALLYVLDMPSGAAEAAEVGAHWAVVGAITGFCGLCIAAQNMAILKPLGLRWREYIAARAFAAAVSAGIVAARFELPGAAAPAMATAGGVPAMELSTLAALLLLMPVLFALARKKPNS